MTPKRRRGARGRPRTPQFGHRLFVRLSLEERHPRLPLNAMAYERTERRIFEPWVAQLLGGVILLFALVPLSFALLIVALYGSTDTSTAEWSVAGALSAAAPFAAAGMGAVACAVHLFRYGRSHRWPRLAGSIARAALYCVPFLAAMVYLITYRE